MMPMNTCRIEPNEAYPIMGKCPICGTVVPIIFLRVTVNRGWKRTVNVEVSGDATDWVSHMWAHQFEVRS
jgi:hypothetical protein